MAVGDAYYGKTTLLIAFSTDKVQDQETPQTYKGELIDVDVEGKKYPFLFVIQQVRNLEGWLGFIVVMYEVICASPYRCLVKVFFWH